MRSALSAFVILALVPVASGDEKKAAERLAAVVEKAADFDLYSLEPGVEDEKDGFHGYKVLGKVAVKDDATRKALAAAFRKAVEEKGLAPARCFIPRHGIRVQQDGNTVDLVICFECFQVKDFVGDRKGTGCLIGRSAQPAFDKVLKDAGVPLAKKAD